MAKRSKLAWTNDEAQAALDRYEGLVRAMSRRLRPLASAGRALDEEDLHAEGRVAVLEALSSYQGYGIQEQTWVRTRVRQRLIDAIRRLDPRSRDEMRLVVKHAAGDTNGDEERRGRAVAARRLVSMDASAPYEEPMSARLIDDRTPWADEAAHANHQREQLMEALDILPKRQRMALELGLFQGLPLKEIGRRMGISESRVCQLQKRAVQHLNGRLAEAA
ncbi:MAG TPA: sigma-70 family RNA polymerase sigma factor [Sandaracinaceae bacterium LLY-WYZ-13_1]|nr:sigma-70 family RNA polymerase sigma factor [Sandaracinaceae bacterium LLY-WYZ-13_1]